MGLLAHLLEVESQNSGAETNNTEITCSGLLGSNITQPKWHLEEDGCSNVNTCIYKKTHRHLDEFPSNLWIFAISIALLYNVCLCFFQNETDLDFKYLLYMVNVEGKYFLGKVIFIYSLCVLCHDLSSIPSLPVCFLSVSQANTILTCFPFQSTLQWQGYWSS